MRGHMYILKNSSNICFGFTSEKISQILKLHEFFLQYNINSSGLNTIVDCLVERNHEVPCLSNIITLRFKHPHVITLPRPDNL